MKDTIRKEMLSKRDLHHSSGGHVHCLNIMDRFLRLQEFDASKLLLLYASKGSEVHTDGILKSALSLGKRVALPVTIKEKKTIEIYEIKDVSELATGAFGILEPQIRQGREVKPEEIDLVVVPGISFDRRGQRIGYGMGYYDSLLKKISGKKVALAYNMQLVDSVPDEPHDISVDLIVTEEGPIYCGGEKQAPAHKNKMKIVVLASGKGSDFQSIIDGVKSGNVAADIVGLITDNPEAGAIARARENGVMVFVIPHKNRQELDDGIKAKLDELKPSLVVLAGYMKIISGKEILSEYGGMMINIHPSLLPKYPGAHAQRDAFEAGEKVSGYTIHFVDASLDGGPTIYQEKVDIAGCKSADEAAECILKREHIGLPKVVDAFCRGKISLSEGKTKIHEPF